MPADKPREVVVPASRETISRLNRSDQIYDREEDKDKIVQILVNDVKEDQGISVLPIIGVGGLGKTTLAQLVFNELQQEKWFELKNSLSCGSTGASIIVTTRQKKVAHIMGTLPAHRLKGLSDDNCWMLLRSQAFGPNEVVSPHLEIIGKEIVKKCAGVHIIATALG